MPVREQFLEGKEASQVPLGCCPRAALFRHALCYYNSVPFSFFHIFTELNNQQDEFCQLLKSPQAMLLHFLLQPPYSSTGRNSSLLQSFQLHKPAVYPSTCKTNFLTMARSLLSAFHPSPGPVLHPWWINFDHGSHCRLFIHTNRQNPATLHHVSPVFYSSWIQLCLHFLLLGPVFHLVLHTTCDSQAWVTEGWFIAF